MGKKKTAIQLSSPNVINLKLDAGFYFERAMQSLDRFHYDKALKYLYRTIETEPGNSLHHINLAGVLSETGDYEKSNEMLQYVLESLDANLTECHYYIANNYLNMDELELAERSLLLYLELDEQGVYLDEAEEMIELLAMELGRPVPIAQVKCRQEVFEHDQARLLLEEGRFNEAARKLEHLANNHPEFMAARNNLALAHYYLGQLDQAVETIEGVLEEEPGNLHGLCNLAILYLQMERHDQVSELVRMLEKLIPVHPEHVFKLATTMGILNRHDLAYNHFRRLLKTGMMEQDACLYHYTAVAATHLGKFGEARWLWKQASKVEPESEVASYYLNRLPAFEDGERPISISYHYHLPFEEQFKWFETMHKTAPERMKRDPLIRSSFIWALRHGDHDMKLQVIQAFGLIADGEVELALKDFLQQVDEDDDLKRAAIMVLKTMGAKGPYKAVMNGQQLDVQTSEWRSTLPMWKPEWQVVIDTALLGMEKRYDLIERHDLHTLWVEYLSRMYPGVPHIRRPEGWSAALEYLIAKMHRRQITYQEVAAQYEVSVSTVRRNASMIDKACGLREKMEAIFPKFSEKI